MQVEIYSDAVCPWCFLGKRRFEAALAARPALEVDVRWLPFELNPGLPPDGMDRRTYLERKFGDPARFGAAQAQLRTLGTDLGIAFDFEAITRMPNTRRAHALVMLAEHAGRSLRVVEDIFEAYFSAGLDIGDPAVLARLAAAAGIDTQVDVSVLDDPARHAEIARLESQAQAWGISGVPAFVFDRKHLVSGAQEVEVFGRVLDTLAAAASGEAANA